MLEWLLIMALYQRAGSDPIAEAREAIARKEVVRAKARLMAAEPRTENLVRLAEGFVYLAELQGDGSGVEALLKGYTDAKEQKRLKRNPSWRGVGLLGLAILAQRRGDESGFRSFAAAFFREFPAVNEDAIRYRLLFHLAAQGPVLCGPLMPEEALWADGATHYQKTGTWIKGGPSPLWPQEIRLWFALSFEREFGEWVASQSQLGRERYPPRLLAMSKALRDGDLSRALELANQFDAIDRRLNDLPLRLLFLPLLAEAKRQAGQPDEAAEALAKVETFAKQVLLPVVRLPHHKQLEVKKSASAQPVAGLGNELKPSQAAENATGRTAAAEVAEAAQPQEAEPQNVEPLLSSEQVPSEPRQSEVSETSQASETSESQPVSSSASAPSGDVVATLPAAEEEARSPSLAQEPPAIASEQPPVEVANLPAPAEEEAPSEPEPEDSVPEPTFEAGLAEVGQPPAAEVVAPPVPEAAQESDVPTIKEAQPPVPQPSSAPSAPEPSPLAAFIRLERELARGAMGLELDIRALPGRSMYQKLYRNYLLGLFFLKRGRLESAFEFLNLSEKLVGSYPFADLEYKIYLALADYHQNLRAPDRAEWYRISASSIWDNPANLPLFSDPELLLDADPFADQIDEVLRGEDPTAKTDRLLYLICQSDLLDLRRRACHRQVLAESKGVARQLGELSQQTQALLHDLRLVDGNERTPQRFNHLVGAWQKLWPLSRPWFLDKTAVTTRDLQLRLGASDRLLLFVEGRERLGLLFFTKTQAFHVDLGEKASFIASDAAGKRLLLQAKVGPVWNGDGAFLLLLSKSSKQTAFVEELRAQMSRPERLVLPFSLRQFTAAPAAGECGRLVLLGPQIRLDALRAKLGSAASELEWRPTETLARDSWTKELGKIESLLLAGPISRSPEGPLLGTLETGLPLLDLAHLPGRICAIGLHDLQGQDWIPLLADLQLIAPGLAIRYHFLNASDPGLTWFSTGQGDGLHFHSGPSSPILNQGGPTTSPKSESNSPDIRE